VKKEEAQSDPKIRFDYSSSQVLAIVFPAIYAAALVVFCLVYNVFPGPEFLVLCFLIYAVYNKRSQRFVKDWAPFVLLFLSYEAMFGMVGNLSRIVHVVEPITVDMRIFGAIPALVLQQYLRTRFLDYLCAFFYSLHFIAPTVFAFVLWKFSRKNYWKYTFALAVCTYGALVTFLVYPIAPPWYGVKATRVLLAVDHDVGVPMYRTIFDFIQSNPFAAFPSLHSTYPWLIALFALKIKGRKALPILVLPFGIWFSAVYLGEHYVIDVIGGIAYATFAFVFVEKIVPRLLSRYSSLRRFMPKLDAQEQTNLALEANLARFEPRASWISVHPYVSSNGIQQVYSLNIYRRIV
jgi:membrane-associated phospholipid phosphatase